MCCCNENTLLLATIDCIPLERLNLVVASILQNGGKFNFRHFSGDGWYRY